MRETGSANRAIRRSTALPEGPLEIEIIRDEDYRNSSIYCSWQEIIAGDSVAKPDVSLSEARMVFTKR